MPQNRTLLEELSSAARGIVALMTGNRSAPGNFDFSHRGLAGSFIAFLVANVAVAFGPQLLGMQTPPGMASRALILGFVLYVIQQGIAFLVLRQMKRTDGFIPFLVADNWATFFTSLLSLGLLLLGGGSDVSLIVIGLIVIIIEVNIGRLIVTLSPLQVATFIIAQVVGSVVCLLVLSMLMPNAGLIPTL
ncbi:hypothetical protein [Devosia sp.]|uniref:hypothetical protein n=1 Tax=Devosia sp. TaxID=1871048 RepID=UPI00326794C9